MRVLDRSDRLETAMRALRRRGVLRAIKRWIVNRDAFAMADLLAHRKPALIAQRFVPGQVGDAAIFCLGGELLGMSVAIQEQCAYEKGPSTIVRLIDRPELVAGARRLVEAHGLSGFIGLDFIIDAAGEVRVIEVNPRATPLGGAADGRGCPVAAAARALGATGVRDAGARRDLIAYFPAAWHLDPTDERLALCARDVPQGEPALLAELLRKPWWERSLLAVLAAPLLERVTGRKREGALATGRSPLRQDASLAGSD